MPEFVCIFVWGHLCLWKDVKHYVLSAGQKYENDYEMWTNHLNYNIQKSICKKIRSITLIWYSGIWDPPTHLLGHRGPPSLTATAKNKRVICPYRLACPWGKKDPREEDIGFALHFKTTAVTYSCEGLCLFILPHQQLTKCEHQYVVRRRIFHKFAQTHLHCMLWLQSRHSRQFLRTTLQRSSK